MFDACRQISALEAARRLCLPLKQKGHRYWVCCPMHGEKTPSMMFDEGGRWHCFGCNKGGDAVALYAEFFNERPYQAAIRLAADFGITIDTSKPRKPMPEMLFRLKSEKADREKEHLLLLIKHTANLIMYHSKGDILWEALELWAKADIDLMNIDAAAEEHRYISNRFGEK